MILPQQPAALPDINLEHAELKFPPSLLGDPRALSTVVKTFDQWASARQRNADHRWIANDQMYLGQVEQKFWPDKKTKRSALGIPITFDQVESVYPILSRALFGRDRWFGVKATAFSTPEMARDLEKALKYQFESPQDSNGGTAMREMKLALRDFLQHGEGIAEIGWDPVQATLFVENVPVKDFYFDPQLGHPDINRAKALMRRTMISLDDLEKLRGIQPYNIPSKAILRWAAQGSPTHPGDDIDNALSAFRGDQPSNQAPVNPDPIYRPVEVIKYCTDDRWIWVLNRRVVILNTPNPFGTKNYVGAPATILVGKAYGISIPDMLEGEQALIQGLTNAQIDEASLALMPPRYRNPMAGNTTARNTWAPGEVEDVSGDSIEVAWPQGVVQQTFPMLGMAQQRAQRRFGISEMTQSGTPTPSNANRTLGGINQQSGGTMSRLQAPLENFEDYFLVPLFYKAQTILNKVLPGSLPSIPAGEQQQVPRSILGAPVHFIMSAASRLAARAELQQILSPVSQTLLSQPVMNAAKGQGQTMDFKEWNRFFLDATTGEEYQFYRPMTEEEAQFAQQPDPETMARLQQQQQAEQTRRDIAQQKNQTQIQVAQIESQTDAEDRSERSSTEILKLLSGEKNDRLKAILEVKKGEQTRSSDK